MGEIQLEPVRHRGRFALDRGALVVAGIVVTLAVALVKPWSSGAPTETTPVVAEIEADAAVTAGAPATLAVTPETDVRPAASYDARPSPSPRSLATPSTISLVDVRLRGASEGAAYDVFSALVATNSETTRVPFFDSVPPVTELGYCDRGALLGAPVQAIAFSTAMVPVTSYELARVFEKGEPVAIPVESLEIAADGSVLSAPGGDGFPVGHYALILRAYGAIRVVPLCVAEVMRLQNGARARYVPQEASTAAARKALLRDIANVRSE